MKIERFDRASSIVGAKEAEDKKIRNSKHSSFGEQYNQFRDNNEQEYLKRAMSEIEEQGERLKARMEIRDFLEYKSKIGDLLSYLTKNSHKYSKETRFSRNGNYKVWGVIEKVNDELEALTKEILEQEKDRIKIIERLDKIQGMLLDVTM